jgi:predicted metallo-beta-lactamase superfamily hydrolase
MGVRSSAILVEKNDLRIVIDPAVALAPNRFGLSPHSLEKGAKDVLWSKVKQEVVKADIIVVTHYHFDHFDPKEPDIYEQKIVLLKNPRRMINPSQKARASSFIRSIKKIADEIYYVDNKKFNFEEIKIIFSKPVPHGITAARGYVVEVYLESVHTA